MTTMAEHHLQGSMERARSVRGSDWFASMDATHGHLTAEEMTPQARSGHLPISAQSTTKLRLRYSKNLICRAHLLWYTVSRLDRSAAVSAVRHRL